MMDVSFVNKNWLYKICLVCLIIVAWPDLFFVPFFIHHQCYMVSKKSYDLHRKTFISKSGGRNKFWLCLSKFVRFWVFLPNKKSFFILSKGRRSEHLHWCSVAFFLGQPKWVSDWVANFRRATMTNDPGTK